MAPSRQNFGNRSRETVEQPPIERHFVEKPDKPKSRLFGNVAVATFGAVTGLCAFLAAYIITILP